MVYNPSVMSLVNFAEEKQIKGDRAEKWHQ